MTKRSPWKVFTKILTTILRLILEYHLSFHREETDRKVFCEYQHGDGIHKGSHHSPYKYSFSSWALTMESNLKSRQLFWNTATLAKTTVRSL